MEPIRLYEWTIGVRFAIVTFWYFLIVVEYSKNKLFLNKTKVFNCKNRYNIFLTEIYRDINNLIARRSMCMRYKLVTEHAWFLDDE